MAPDGGQVPNLRLRALRDAVEEAEQALQDVSPTGYSPTGQVAGILSRSWSSDTAEAQIADLDGTGRVLHRGFVEAVEQLRALEHAEAREPWVAPDDARGNPALYAEPGS